ncbi:MAG: hypothetical protein HC889_18825 [Synechococcaceae cyanobacterium SM1_2_3]|nr:hypothetical protein [Synechococcaceae cyanobacterium SM1_2_3]
MTTEEFAKGFKYDGGSLIAPWKDARKKMKGDCQDFAWTVLLIETGGKLQALLAILTLRAMIWRCWSPVNGAVPRHAALRLRGKGWIDSTEREWRDTVSPHKKAWPAGLPVVLGIAALIWAPEWMAFAWGMM